VLAGCWAHLATYASFGEGANDVHTTRGPDCLVHVEAVLEIAALQSLESANRTPRRMKARQGRSSTSNASGVAPPWIALYPRVLPVRIHVAPVA